jgi:serine/threonine-protein kinase
MADILDRLKAALSDRYRIERELGSGGMATVYLAHDPKHDRNVAVKVFRSELAAALGTERFFREIKITANLQHPHILPLHDSGEADGFLYYVMPYVEGESLRDRLNRDKQLPVDDALKITSQVASALSYAHSRDIVHRDIKPENILFQAGEVVVADFGIALAVDSAGGTRLTETGFLLGTPAYMSPEQVSGEQEIDGRSDIYSLACVLYEMLAGDPPFLASNPRAVLAKHMTEPAPSITTVRSNVPPPAASAIAKALGKARADRFDSVKTFSEALLAEMAEAEPEVKSIVVLPFENLSPDPDQEYFSDGLTEEVISDLSKVRALRVISRSSAMTFKGSDKRIPEIARELNVRYALEGSVRKAGNNLRITAQLIHAVSDAHVWAEKYDGVLEDVFGMQEQVSRSIVEAMELQLLPEEEKHITERKIEDPKVYALYMKARHEMLKGTAEATRAALRNLELGLEILGDNELLYYGMAYALIWGLEYGVMTEDEAMGRVEELAARVREMAPGSASSLSLDAWLERFRGRPLEGLRKAASALAADPQHLGSMALIVTGYAGQVGRPELAEVVARRFAAADPLTPLSTWQVGFHHWMSGRLDEALTSFDTGLRVDPPFFYNEIFAAYVHVWQGRVENAEARLAPMIGPDPTDLFSEWATLMRCGLDGDAVGAREALSEGSKTYLWNDLEFPPFIASAYALAGAREEALTWLERAVERGWINYPLFAHQDPLLESIRGEDRFQKLMVTVKREWKEFEV